MKNLLSSSYHELNFDLKENFPNINTSGDQTNRDSLLFDVLLKKNNFNFSTTLKVKIFCLLIGTIIVFQTLGFHN